MFQRTLEGIYQSDLLLAQPWLNHGFGSRHVPAYPGHYVRVCQVHSARIIVADLAQDPPEADAIVTGQPDVWIGIRTADCVPLLLADRQHRCIAAIHAGWRGTVQNIASAAVMRMQDEFGSKPEDLITAIGPSIGRCCFAVGTDVADQFDSLFPEATDRGTVDLSEANRRQLLASGVQAGNIDVSGLCTKCNSEDFHSWRRDREASGRMTSAIRIAGQPA